MRFVPVKYLKPGMVLGKNIKNTVESTLLRNGVELTDRFIEQLKVRGYIGAYIIDEISEGIDIPETIPEKLFDEGVRAVKDADIESLVHVAKKITAEIVANENISSEMNDLRSYDDYTYHHSVNVGLYATLMGRKMRMNSKDLENLCLSGICHDLGKTMIPASIINKPGKLTSEEYNLVKNHSRYSYEILSENYNIPARVKQAVLYHHENENGTGYPDQKEGDEIPLFSKILHVADVYDALTSKRPYKEPYTTADALEYMMGGSGILFSWKAVSALLQAVPAYRAGTEVVLSNGESALVVRNSELALRPVIRMMSTGEDIDLSLNPRYMDIVIESRERVESDYAREVERLSRSISNKRPKKKKPTILMTDDMITGLMSLKRSLEDEFKVVMAKNAAQALTYVGKTGMPDLLILDIEMPGMDGMVTLKTMRERYNLDIPVIFMTGSDRPNLAQQCREMGAVDYIRKPVNPIYVRERVKVALDHYEENLCR